MIEIRAAKPAQVFEQCWRSCAMWSLKKADYIGAPVTSDSDIRSTLAGNVQVGLAGMDAGNTRALKEVEDYLKFSTSATWIPLWAISSAGTSKGPLAGARSTSQMWWRSL